FEEGGFGGGKGGAGGIHAAEGDVVIDLAAGRDGVGGDIDAETFTEEVVDGLADADVGFDAADEDFPDAAVAPGGENVGAFCAAEGGLGRNGSEKRGKFGRRGAEALRILFGRSE